VFDLAPRPDAAEEIEAFEMLRHRTTGAHELLVDSSSRAQPAEEGFGFEMFANSATGAGLLLSASVLWWATRASGLLAAMMASVPAWRSFDPLPILAQRRGGAPGDDAVIPPSADPRAPARHAAAHPAPARRSLLEEMAAR
jgi:hypothetical protein